MPPHSDGIQAGGHRWVWPAPDAHRPERPTQRHAQNRRAKEPPNRPGDPSAWPRGRSRSSPMDIRRLRPAGPPGIRNRESPQCTGIDHGLRSRVEPSNRPSGPDEREIHREQCLPPDVIQTEEEACQQSLPIRICPQCDRMRQHGSIRLTISRFRYLLPFAFSVRMRQLATCCA